MCCRVGGGIESGERRVQIEDADFPTAAGEPRSPGGRMRGFSRLYAFDRRLYTVRGIYYIYSLECARAACSETALMACYGVG
jgi:hypothetical protein